MGQVSFSGLSTAITNLFIRGFSILARFSLSIYLARIMGLSDVGLFSIFLGIIGFMAPLLGLGLNYFVSREIVDLSRIEAGRKIRDRLIVTAAGSLVATIIFALLIALGVVRVPNACFVLVLIIIGEVFSADIHISLIGLRMPLFASALLFVRTASWVFIFITISFFYVKFRRLDFAYDLWLVALGVNYLALSIRFAKWPWREIAAFSIDVGWIKNYIRQGWLIYISDLAMAGSFYADRFIVNDLEGLKNTGIYMFFWSVANSSQTLVSSSIIQISQPRLIAAYRSKDDYHWRAILFQETWKVLFAGLILTIFGFILIVTLLPYVHRNELYNFIPMFAILLVASVFRMLSDMMNYGMCSRGFDGQYATTNIGGIIITVSLAIICLTLFGINGIAVSTLCSAIILLIWRLYILKDLFLSSDRERIA